MTAQDHLAQGKQLDQMYTQKQQTKTQTLRSRKTAPSFLSMAPRDWDLTLQRSSLGQWLEGPTTESDGPT